MPPTVEELEALGTQYREARDSVGEHRRRQAAAEVALGRLMRRLGPDHPDVATARAAVDKAHADVRWCQAATIAAGEAYKGCRFEDVPNRMPDRADLLARIADMGAVEEVSP